MEEKEIKNIWNFSQIRAEYEAIVDENSEIKLLNLLKNNTFFFYELHKRKMGVEPIFHEVSLGTDFRCDFVWLNANSDGPEWTLLEIEKPKMKLFRKNFEPTKELNHSIEQVKSWRRYFEEYPSEKKKIFGAVSKFRYIIVGGLLSDWENEKAAKWRIDNNKNTNIEIRSIDVFSRALNILERNPNELWSFAQNNRTLAGKELTKYWQEYDYFDFWRKIIS